MLPSVSTAGEWTHWRGPSYDGVATETGLVSSWSLDGEGMVWKADFIGRSTPVVLDGQVCVIGRVGEGIDRQEVVACFDAEDGRKRWEHRFNVYLTTVPFNRVGWASLVADPQTGNLYAHGVAGQLIAYDSDGKILWWHSLAEEYQRLSGYGGRTQTPLIAGDQLIINFVSSGWGATAPLRHRYFSFDKRDGTPLWISTPGRMPKDFNTQSNPVLAEIGGRQLIVAGGADGWVYALLAGTGEKVWEFELSKRGLNSTVLVHGDRVYAGHSEENVDEATMGRVVCIDGTGSGNVTATHEVWRSDELTMGFPSPTIHDRTLIVVDNSANMHGLDAKTGETKWTYSLGTVGKGSPVVADGKIYATEVNGRFHILELGPQGPTPLDFDELSVADGRYAEIYGSPAIAYGRVYFTTEGGVYCLGDRAKRIDAPKRKKDSGRAKPGRGEAASLHVVPAEIILRPGQPQPFEPRLFDAAGRRISSGPVGWTLDGLNGTVDSKGSFESDPQVRFQAGRIVARAGDLEGSAGVRVVADLPWTYDFEDYTAGQSPSHWVGADKKYVVGDLDGNKVLVKAPRERGLNRTFLYMGPASYSNYTIEADVMGAPHKRRRPDIGVIAGGYILDLQGAQQNLQVRSWTSELRMAKDEPFAWEMETWYRMKLRVDVDDKKGLIRGKVWKKSEPEPEAWTISVEDPHPIPGGSPGLLGYSPVNLYYDNIRVTVNQK